MAGATAAGLLVRRVRREAAGVADGRRVDAVGLPELALGAPEAAEPEHRGLETLRPRPDQRLAVDEVLLGNRHRLIGAAGQRLVGADHLLLLVKDHDSRLRAVSAPSNTVPAVNIRETIADDLPAALALNNAQRPCPQRARRRRDRRGCSAWLPLALTAEVDGAFAGFCITFPARRRLRQPQLRLVQPRTTTTSSTSTASPSTPPIAGSASAGPSTPRSSNGSPGFPHLLCEVNVRPRNEASLLFHHSIGFREVGQQDTDGGKKTVSLLGPATEMKHAGRDALEAIEPLLESIRAVPGSTERQRGVFYRKSKAFLHFHEDPSGMHADVRVGAEFERYRAGRRRTRLAGRSSSELSQAMELRDS